MLLREKVAPGQTGHGFIVNGRSVKDGEPFEVPDDVGEALRKRYTMLERLTGTEEVPDETSDPSGPAKLGAGWWAWQGKKYRKAQLPAEALALIE